MLFSLLCRKWVGVLCESAIAVVFQNKVKYGVVSAQLGPTLLRLSSPFSLRCWLWCTLAGKKFISRRWERRSEISVKSTQGLSGMQRTCIPCSHHPLRSGQPLGAARMPYIVLFNLKTEDQSAALTPHLGNERQFEDKVQMCFLRVHCLSGARRAQVTSHNFRERTVSVLKITARKLI